MARTQPALARQGRSGRGPGDPVVDAIHKRLAAAVDQRPELAEAAALYREMLPLLRRAQAEVPPFELAPQTIERKFAAGLPLLVGEDLPLDLDATRALFLRLCRLLEQARPTTGELPGTDQGKRSRWPGALDPLKLIDRARSGDAAALQSAAAAQIRRAAERQELDLVDVWQALARGDWPRLEVIASSHRLDAGLLRVLAESSLKPALRVWAQALAPAVDAHHWQRGYCPLCGSAPALSEIQGKEGARRLRCGVCGADWYYPRLKCAYCAGHDYRRLGQITVDGEEDKYRVQTCDVCGGYLKVVVTFDPTPADLLAVEDLATLHLDAIAQERGYQRVPVR